MHTYMHIPLCKTIYTYVYIYIYVYMWDIVLRYYMLPSHRQPVLQATEPKATIPTGNRSPSIERSLGRGPWRIPGGSLEGPCISQCCVFQRFERILRNLWRVPRGSPAKSCWKVPRGAWCKPCSVVQIIAGTSVSAPGGDAQTSAIYEYTYTYIYTYIYVHICSESMIFLRF